MQLENTSMLEESDSLKRLFLGINSSYCTKLLFITQPVPVLKPLSLSIKTALIVHVMVHKVA